MDFKKKENYNKIIVILLSLFLLTTVNGINIDCNGKAFYCVNSTHFKICVDLGGGISKTVDDFLLPCPQNTLCKETNIYECEYYEIAIETTTMSQKETDVIVKKNIDELLPSTVRVINNTQNSVITVDDNTIQYTSEINIVETTTPYSNKNKMKSNIPNIEVSDTQLIRNVSKYKIDDPTIIKNKITFEEDSAKDILHKTVFHTLYTTPEIVDTTTNIIDTKESEPDITEDGHISNISSLHLNILRNISIQEISFNNRTNDSDTSTKNLKKNNTLIVIKPKNNLVDESNNASENMLLSTTETIDMLSKIPLPIKSYVTKTAKYNNNNNNNILNTSVINIMDLSNIDSTLTIEDTTVNNIYNSTAFEPISSSIYDADVKTISSTEASSEIDKNSKKEIQSVNLNITSNVTIKQNFNAKLKNEDNIYQATTTASILTIETPIDSKEAYDDTTTKLSLNTNNEVTENTVLSTTNNIYTSNVLSAEISNDSTDGNSEITLKPINLNMHFLIDQVKSKNNINFDDIHIENNKKNIPASSETSKMSTDIIDSTKPGDLTNEIHTNNNNLYTELPNRSYILEIYNANTVGNFSYVENIELPRLEMQETTDNNIWDSIVTETSALNTIQHTNKMDLFTPETNRDEKNGSSVTTKLNLNQAAKDFIVENNNESKVNMTQTMFNPFYIRPIVIDTISIKNTSYSKNVTPKFSVTKNLSLSANPIESIKNMSNVDQSLTIIQSQMHNDTDIESITIEPVLNKTNDNIWTKFGIKTNISDHEKSHNNTEDLPRTNSHLTGTLISNSANLCDKRNLSGKIENTSEKDIKLNNKTIQVNLNNSFIAFNSTENVPAEGMGNINNFTSTTESNISKYPKEINFVATNLTNSDDHYVPDTSVTVKYDLKQISLNNPKNYLKNNMTLTLLLSKSYNTTSSNDNPIENFVTNTSFLKFSNDIFHSMTTEKESFSDVTETPVIENTTGPVEILTKNYLNVIEEILLNKTLKEKSLFNISDIIVNNPTEINSITTEETWKAKNKEMVTMYGVELVTSAKLNIDSDNGHNNSRLLKSLIFKRTDAEIIKPIHKTDSEHILYEEPYKIYNEKNFSNDNKMIIYSNDVMSRNKSYNKTNFESSDIHNISEGNYFTTQSVVTEQIYKNANNPEIGFEEYYINVSKDVKKENNLPYYLSNDTYNAQLSVTQISEDSNKINLITVPNQNSLQYEKNITDIYINNTQDIEPEINISVRSLNITYATPNEESYDKDRNSNINKTEKETMIFFKSYYNVTDVIDKVTKLNDSDKDISSPIIKSQVKLKIQNVREKFNPHINDTLTAENSCINRPNGKYAIQSDCRIFYVCFSGVKTFSDQCPNGTVFSEDKKQCTKNLSRCYRNYQFMCLFPGRYYDVKFKNIYYICIKNKNRFIKFKYQCKNGYSLNKTIIQCIKNSTENYNNIHQSSSSNTFKETIISDYSKESNEYIDESIKEFECKKEGRFSHPKDCAQYYVCTLTKNNVFRRKLKKCDSGETFDEGKNKCVDSDSNECK